MSQQDSDRPATGENRMSVSSPCDRIPGVTYANQHRWDKIKDDRIIRIFLSSTFRDMQRERDTFFQYGEPRLREWAKKKGLALDFIDLRWGLTTEVSSNGEVTTYCCESIEQCPYFLCILGSRYGWIPDHSKPSEWHADTDKRYPFLKEYGDLSVTHYEIKYGALKKNPVARRAFFYERDEAYVLANTHDLTADERILYQAVDEKDRTNQCAMKQEIRQKFDVKMYQSARELTELIVDDMIAVFEVDFGDMKPVSEDEDQAHEQLMRHRLSGFEGRTELLENLSKNVKDQLGNNATKIFLIGAESGVGKSSVMAALARELKKDSSLHLISHFVGCSNLSQYVERLNQRIYRILYDRQVFTDPPDSEQGKEFIKKGLDEILKQASIKSSFPIVLLVDAVNQLVDSQDYSHVHQLNWLPKSLPKNVALVVSTIDTHASCHAAREAGLEITPLSRLSANEVIQAAESFLKKYDKTLSQVQRDLILKHIKDTGHPLYLRIILDEMRVFGVFETVNQELQELLKTNGVLELYDLLMSRWEKQYNSIRFFPQSPITFEIVGKVISVLRVSRIGLDDNELDDYITHLLGRKLVGEEISIWNSFFFKLIDSLFVRNGRYTFFHQLLEQAVQNRYLWNSALEVKEKRMYGLWLLGRYDANLADAAVVAEICHSLCFGKEYTKLERFLVNEKVVTLMLNGRYKYEFYSCWRILNKNGFDHKKTYGEMTKTFTDAGSKLVEYFQDIRESDFLIPIIQARITGRASEDEKAADYEWLGKVFDDKGQYDQALEYHHKSLIIRIKTLGEEHSNVADSYNNIAIVYYKQRKYEQALEYFCKSLAIRMKTLGEEHPNVADSYNGIAVVYDSQGKYEQALEYYHKSLAIRIKTLGEEHPDVADSYNNIASVSYNQRKYEQALKFYHKSLANMINTLGEEHPNVATSYNNIAIVYHSKGMYEQALEFYHKSLAIKRKTLGEEHPNVATSYNNIAIVYHSKGIYEQALEHYHKSLAIRIKMLGEEHPNVAASYNGIAGVYDSQGKYEQALEYYHKLLALRIKTLGEEHPKVAMSYNNIAIVYDIQGKFEQALEFYHKSLALRIKTLGEESPGVAISYYNMAGLFENQRQFQQAIEFFTKARDIYARVYGANHPETANAQNRIDRVKTKGSNTI